MEFNIDLIEAASVQIFKGTGEEQQNANSLLLSWLNSPGSEILAFQILQNPGTSQFAKNSSCSIIQNVMTKQIYAGFDPESRLNFRRNTLISLSANFHNNLIAKKIAYVLTLISLYDWPENWPQFPFDVYPSQENENGFLKSVFFINLFNEFINQVFESKLIDVQRRIFLVSNLKNLSPQIFSIVIPSLEIGNENPEIFKNSMELLSNLLKISPIENFQNENVLNYILSTFSMNDSIVHIEWLKFAGQLLLKHPNRKQLLETFSKPILTTACQIETHSTYLSHFLTKYLTKFSDDLIILGMKESNETGSNEFLQAIAKQYLMTLVSPVINTSEVYDIWYLWLSYFRSTEIELPSGGPETVSFPSPLYSIISFEDILNPLLEMLYLSSYLGLVSQKVIFKCMNAFYEVYKENLNTFFIQSDPVPNTSIALGLLWSEMEDRKQLEIASVFYSKVSSFINPATVICMSFCTLFLSQNLTAQNLLTEVICDFLKPDNSQLIEPASHSLSFLSENLPKIFFNNGEALLVYLLSNMSFILSDDKNGIRIFKSICRATISSAPTDRRRAEILAGLSNTVLEYLSDEATLFTGLKCLTVQPDKSSIFQYVMEKLLSLQPLIFEFPNKDIVNSYFAAVSKAFVSVPFESVRGVFLEMLATLFQKPFLVCQTFSLVENIRRNFPETEQIFPELMPNLILPYLGSRVEKMGESKSISDPTQQVFDESYVELDPEFFSMAAEFTPQLFRVPQIVHAFMFGIKDMRHEVVRSAIVALKTLIEKIPQIELISFFQTFRRGFLNAVLSAVFDMLHASSFSQHVKLLRFFFEKSKNIAFELEKQGQDNSIDMRLFEQEFCEEIAANLNLNLAEEANLNMLRDLFQRLSICYLTPNFKNILKDFLFSMDRGASLMNIEEQYDLLKSKQFEYQN